VVLKLGKSEGGSRINIYSYREDLRKHNGGNTRKKLRTNGKKKWASGKTKKTT